MADYKVGKLDITPDRHLNVERPYEVMTAVDCKMATRKPQQVDVTENNIRIKPNKREIKLGQTYIDLLDDEEDDDFQYEEEEKVANQTTNVTVQEMQKMFNREATMFLQKHGNIENESAVASLEQSPNKSNKVAVKALFSSKRKSPATKPAPSGDIDSDIKASGLSGIKSNPNALKKFKRWLKAVAKEPVDKLWMQPLVATMKTAIKSGFDTVVELRKRAVFLKELSKKSSKLSMQKGGKRQLGLPRMLKSAIMGPNPELEEFLSTSLFAVVRILW